MKCLKLSLIALSLYSATAHADPMQTIFNDMYNSTPPRFSQQGNGRYGVSLGSFSYRPNISQPANIVAARMPNFKMDGCGNIDMFVGSFSMISGDELSQMARAIMQGAATYAFDLALTSISPMASDIKKELTRMVQEMNKFSKNGCEIGANLAAKAAENIDTSAITELKLMESQFVAVASKIGGAADYFEGAYSDMSSLSERTATTGVKIDYNSTKSALDKQGAFGSFFDNYGSINRNELAMTFFGTTITSTGGGSCTEGIENGESTCVTYYPAKGPEHFINLFFDVQNFKNESDVTIPYYKCNNSDCTEITETTNTSERFLPLLIHDINALWSAMADGSTALTRDQQILNYYLGNDMIQNMTLLGPGDSYKEAYSTLKGLQMTKIILEHIALDMLQKTGEAFAKESAANAKREVSKAGLPQSIKSLKIFTKQYQIAVETKLTEHIQRIQAEYSNLFVLLMVK